MFSVNKCFSLLKKTAFLPVGQDVQHTNCKVDFSEQQRKRVALTGHPFIDIRQV